MYEVAIDASFAAAHHLRDYEGVCERLHGHNYRVRVVLAGERLNKQGFLIDFREARQMVGGAVERFDHAYLNELPPFDTLNPTAEQIARHIAECVAAAVPEGIVVRRVTCWESDRCSATYRPRG